MRAHSGAEWQPAWSPAQSGMMVAEKRNAMKTCVGRTMQQMGTAVDGALSDLMHTVR